MLQILGVGAAFPDGALSEKDILAVTNESSRPQISGLDSPAKIFSSLPIGSIKQAAANPKAAREIALHSPSQLGVAAVKSALADAGIASESIGLFLGDTGTPYETCPAEAQRIACAFGLKTQAYDIVTGAGVLPLYLSTLKKWKKERLPDYIVCVTSNTFTHYVNYLPGRIEPYILSDGSAAMVVSPRFDGKLELKASYLAPAADKQPVLSITTEAVLNPANLLPAQALRDFIEQALFSLLAGTNLKRSDLQLIGLDLYGSQLTEVLADLGINADQYFSAFPECGYVGGANMLLSLERCIKEQKKDRSIVALSVENGLGAGCLLEWKR